ncbi:MAG TPA: hypothetical protein VFR71_04430, partial [Methyloceanibacter sp.]|nr:hypothetical protein [Methyloceanibacter sp.]
MARKRRSKPARTSKQNRRQPRPAPITLEDFSALFTSWDGQTGDVVATPREASIRACYAVCVTHAGTPGTVMVSASDVGAARQTLDLLKGYFTDRPELSPMLKRVTPDTIHLYGGQQILVTTAPRSPAGLLSAIKLEPSRRSTRP